MNNSTIWREPVDEVRVKVYWNLHKKLFSVVALEGERKGKVIQHANRIELKDVTFKVSEAGRQRVLRERCKNVHAFVIGTRFVSEVGCHVTTEAVTYNPYTRGQFYVKDTGEDIFKSRWVSLHADRSKWCDKKGRYLINKPVIMSFKSYVPSKQYVYVATHLGKGLHETIGSEELCSMN
tara:strand:+ start:2516 stop:3052 length:537 start_codon:yes stop_codon:yes gene_type:complete